MITVQCRIEKLHQEILKQKYTVEKIKKAIDQLSTKPPGETDKYGVTVQRKLILFKLKLAETESNINRNQELISRLGKIDEPKKSEYVYDTGAAGKLVSQRYQERKLRKKPKKAVAGHIESPKSHSITKVGMSSEKGIQMHKVAESGYIESPKSHSITKVGMSSEKGIQTHKVAKSNEAELRKFIKTYLKELNIVKTQIKDTSDVRMAKIMKAHKISENDIDKLKEAINKAESDIKNLESEIGSKSDSSIQQAVGKIMRSIVIRNPAYDNIIIYSQDWGFKG